MPSDLSSLVTLVFRNVQQLIGVPSKRYCTTIQSEPKFVAAQLVHPRWIPAHPDKTNIRAMCARLSPAIREGNFDAMNYFATSSINARSFAVRASSIC